MRRLGRRVRTPRSKGTVMLEFALVLPLFLLFIAVMVDVSRLMFLQNAAQDAAFAAARAGAQIGYGDPFRASAAAESAFQASYANKAMPSLTMNPIDECSSAADPYYEVEVNFNVDLMFWNFIGLPNTMSSTAKGLSRCEIVRV